LRKRTGVVIKKGSRKRETKPTSTERKRQCPVTCVDKVEKEGGGANKLRPQSPPVWERGGKKERRGETSPASAEKPLRCGPLERLRTGRRSKKKRELHARF